MAANDSALGIVAVARMSCSVLRAGIRSGEIVCCAAQALRQKPRLQLLEC